MNLLEIVAASPLVDRFGYGLVHSLWGGVLIAAVLAPALRALRGRPAARHAAAWLALAMMAAVVPLAAWLAPVPPTRRPAIVAASSPIERRASPGPVVVASDPPGRGLPSPAVPTGRGEAGVGRVASPTGAPALVADASRSERVGSVDGGAGAYALGPWMPWVVVGWSIGAVLLGLWRLAGWLAAGRLCRRGVRPAPAEFQAMLDRLIERMPIHPTVRLLESALATVPAVVGSIRPVILLPVGVVAGLSPREVELILAHELAHIGRRDYLANLIQSAIETCLFYHPAVWWVSGCIRVERERCCDDAVVASTGERMLYARTLTRLAELGGGRRAAAPLVAADDGSLLDRVRRILGLPDERRRWAAARLAGCGAAMGLATGLTAFAALAEPTIRSTTAGAEAIGRPAREDDPAGPDAPRVVEVFPPDGARGVEPITEIRLRFDRPMDPSRAFFAWNFRDRAGYRPRGPLRYDERTRTFSWPVHLTPGGTHRITTGDDVAALPFSWSFTTAGRRTAAGGETPRIVRVDPPPDTEQALLTPLRVTFDRPMDPSSFDVTGSAPSENGRVPGLLDPPDYDPASRTFTLLLRLPLDWNGDVRLAGFRSAEGAEAAPMDLTYRTRREPLARSIRARVERAARDDAGLVRFIERVQAARRGRSGLREDVITAASEAYGASRWRQRYTASGATFAMRDERHFYAEVDEIMGRTFRVGCDGETCWFRYDKGLVTAPFDQVAERNALVGDPFGAASRIKASDVIRDRKLEDLGPADVLGRPCRRIRSWDVQVFASEFVTPPVDWYIDDESLLPARIDTGFSTMDFRYHDLGGPIPDDVFRRRAEPGVREAGAEPLAEGYTRRFLNVIDGSNGRMSVRWGEKGPRGTNSGGLN